VENLAEDADDDFFSRNENHVLHLLLHERNDQKLRRRRHERGLFLVLTPTMPNAISYIQTAT